MPRFEQGMYGEFMSRTESIRSGIYRLLIDGVARIMSRSDSGFFFFSFFLACFPWLRLICPVASFLGFTLHFDVGLRGVFTWHGFLYRSIKLTMTTMRVFNIKGADRRVRRPSSSTGICSHLRFRIRLLHQNID